MDPRSEGSIPLPVGRGRAAARVERAPSFDIEKSVRKLGRPPLAHPRRHGVFVRHSETEWGSIG